MAYLRPVDSQQLIGPFLEEDAYWLLRQLEHARGDIVIVNINRTTVLWLREQGASVELLDALRASLDGHSEADVEVLLDPERTDPMTEDTAEHSVVRLGNLDDKSPSTDVYIGSTRLTCRVCNNARFRHRRAQMHGALASFFNIEWTSPSADCYICTQCGYVHWFMPT